MSSKKFQGSSRNLKFFSPGQSLSCPQTPTDDGPYSRNDDINESSCTKEHQERGFQFRDAFHYYAEDASLQAKDKLHFVDNQQTQTNQPCTYKANSLIATNELMNVLNTDFSYTKNYKVVGTSDSVMIARDIIIDQLVAIKVILKPASDSGKKPYFPLGVPYMVPLIRFHETSSCIFLVLKYLRKKSLQWNFSQGGRQQCEKPHEVGGGYHGCNLLSTEAATEVNGQPTGVALSSSVNDINALQLNGREPVILDNSPASCTCAVAVLDDADKTLSDVSSDALSDISDYGDGHRQNDAVQTNEKATMTRSKTGTITDEEAGLCLNGAASREVNDDSYVKDSKMGQISEEKLLTKNLALYDKNSNSKEEILIKNNLPLGEEYSNDISRGINHHTDDEPQELLPQRYTGVHLEYENHNESMAQNKRDLCQCDDQSENHSVSLSVEDMIKNSRELLNKVSRTLESSNNLSCLGSFPEASCIRRRTKGNRRSESSWDIVQPSESRCNNFNKSVSFDTSEMRNPTGDPEGGSATVAPEGDVKKWISQVIVAIDSLHNQGIIWGDFNPCNVLFDENGRVMLTYKCFLPSAWVENVKQRQWCPEKLVDSYCAPELRNPLHIPTTASDWWSVGALLYQLLTGLAISDVHPTGVTKHTEVHLPDGLSMHACLLLKHILRADPRERLGYDGSMDLKLHPFFEGITWPEDIT